MGVSILDCPGWSDVWVYSAISEKIKEEMETKGNGLTIKEDIRNLREDIALVKVEIASVRKAIA